MSLRLNALLCTSVREIICLSDQEGQPVSWPKKTKNHCWAFETQVWRVLFEGGNPGGVGIGYLGWCFYPTFSLGRSTGKRGPNC